MSIYRHKPTGRWMWEFDHYIAGRRVRRRQLLPAGLTRAQAEDFDRKEGAALWRVANGTERPRWHIAEAVRRWKRERQHTLKHGANMARELDQLADWYAGRVIDDLHAVCRDYATDQAGALAPATIRNRISYLRSVCRWAWKTHGLAEADPGARVMLPPVSNARDVTLSRRELLTACRAIKNRRVRAMLRVLWYTGMRLSEYLRAERHGDAFVLEDTKNGSPRIVPIPARVRAAAAVPVPTRGRYEYWWRVVGREAIGRRDVTLHTMRHSAASEMINAGVDLRTVGAVLGHKSPASTLRYSHWATEQLARAMASIGRKRA